ncbi:MAG: hypothetical protein ACYS8I_13555, partial [Planctomycetota bacterium]
VQYNGNDSAQPIADALFLHQITQLQAVLAVDSFVESFSVWKRHPGSSRPGQTLAAPGGGQRPGRSMSNDNSLYINLRQDTVNARYNGGIYLGGLSENDQDNNRWDDAFLNGPVKLFTDTFESSLSIGGPTGGAFAFAVLSKKFSPPTTTIGTAFEVFRAVASDRVSTQRRRRQKIRGWS